MAELTWLRSRHMELGADLETLRGTADGMDDSTMLELWDRVTGHVSFLVHDLMPFVSVEEEILYPALAVAADTATPVDVLRAHQVEISRLAAELDEGRRSLPLGEEAGWRAVRRTLAGVHAIARLYFTVEDEVILPLLESDLDPHEAEELEDALRAVARTNSTSHDFQQA
ncbi:hemerythrin domain-containing protein [Actinopolymorpha pittospori]